MESNFYNLEELIKTPESNFLDFKKCYWNNNADMVHDILCMANSLYYKERFIILGVEDKTKKIKGIEKDICKKPLHDITNTLINSNINEIPYLALQSCNYQEQKIDVLIIHHFSSHRPYFLNKDYTDKGKTIRQGVIYSRQNDTNTPINQSASNTTMKKLWSEYFGLQSSPLERFKNYLKDFKGWEKVLINQTHHSYFYTKFPEFTVSWNEDDSPYKYNFNEKQNNDGDIIGEERVKWVKNFPNPTATAYIVYLKYHTTILEQKTFFACDCGYFVPEPEYKNDGDIIEYFYNVDEKYYLIWNIFNDIDKTDSTNTEIFMKISGIKKIKNNI